MIIVISTPTVIVNELLTIHALFESGMRHFHIYKPSFTDDMIKSFIAQISPQYHHCISLHDSYFKFHSLQECEECDSVYEYAFLSPVFDSISKVGYRSTFDLENVKTFLKNRKDKIVALSGIDIDKVDAAKAMGFYGVALLGAIWKNENPVEKFKLINEKWQTIKLVS